MTIRAALVTLSALALLGVHAVDCRAGTQGTASSTAANGMGSADHEEKLAKWDATWLQLQQQPLSVSPGDHWRVCEIKFRFRMYRDLFQCLELMDKRVNQLPEGVPEREAGPIISNWMRSFAYLELGQEEAALDAANKAWELLPQGYRDVSRGTVKECHNAAAFGLFCKPTAFQQVAIEAGGTYLGETKVSEGETVGYNNPAGLDLSSQGIAISLAAQRGAILARHGDRAAAKEMLDYIQKWAHLGSLSEVGWASREKVPRQLVGLQFALGDYQGVLQSYKWVRASQHGNAIGRVVMRINSALFLGIPTVADHMFGTQDLRRFASALEDAADEYVYATSLARLGNLVEARKAFEHLLANPELRDMGSLYWAALYEYSQVLRAQGDRGGELQALQRAADAIERVRQSITFESGKIGYAASKQAVYAALVAALASTSDWQGAFQAAERAKARALVDLLAEHHELPPPTGSDAKVQALFASAQSRETDIAFPSSPDAVRGIQVIADARTSLTQIAPEAASLLSVQKVSISDIRARIANDEALIDYYAAGNDLYAFVVTEKAVTGLRMSAKGLEDEVLAFRESIKKRDPSTQSRARDLHERLLRPLLTEIKADKLTIAPHGVLHYLPFDALQDDEAAVIDRYDVRITPSADALVYLRTDRPSKVGKLLALGNPDLGNARYDLPNAQIEALNVASMFPDSRALVRAEASKSAIKELGSSFSMLHFATHGKFDPDAPLTSGLYLAKGTEPDGVLTVNELYSLRWDVDLVTLSACETGLGKVANGDDVIGLTRGFLYAGARSIVASLWEVDDAATEQLMVSFYRNLEGHTKREALRLAQLETRASHPLPVFWAGFQIVGTAN
jgi:CHAT domain-containing protein